MPKDLFMPALGMAQDSGVIAAWRVEAGDRVAPGDVVMEVETDKSVQEIEAREDGYIARLLFEAGAEVPVGEVVAEVVATAEEAAAAAAGAGEGTADTAPGEEDASSDSGSEPIPAPPAEAAPATEPREILPPEPAAAPAPPPASFPGRVLASPKAKAIAAAHGLDLAGIRASVGREPLHARDVEAALSEQSTAPAPASATGPTRLSLRAVTEAGGWQELCARLGGLAARRAALASLVGGAWRREGPDTTGALVVEVVGLHGEPRLFADPDRSRLGAAEPIAEGTPDLRVIDATGSSLREVEGPPEGGADLWLLSAEGEVLSLVLQARSGILNTAGAAAILDGVARRLRNPLYQLL